MTSTMKITQIESGHCKNIGFTYQQKISQFMDNDTLTGHFEDMMTNAILNESSPPVYFPDFMFSETTAKIVYLSNEINAMSKKLKLNFETGLLKTIIAKYIELYTLAEFYMNNEASYPIKNDSLIRELHNKSYDCTQLCSDCNYVDKDNLLFNVMYKFCSNSY